MEREYHSSFANGSIAHDTHTFSRFGYKRPPSILRWIEGGWKKVQKLAHQAFMHTVKGVPRFGLLVDPGASRGLIGTATRREYEQNSFATH